MKAVFGCPLDEHLRLNRRQIALPLELCVCALWELGMTEEGLFRVAGGSYHILGILSIQTLLSIIKT